MADHLSPKRRSWNMRCIRDELGIGLLLLEAQSGRLSHEDTMRSIELFGKEVIPALKED